MEAQNTGVNSRCDLGGAGSLGAVTDGAGEDGDGVDQNVGNCVCAVALEVSDTRACAAACGNGAAVGGQTADACLLVDGDQVGQGHGTDQLLIGDAKLLGVHGHGNGGGDALVAGAGEDDDRHVTAAHSGVGTGGGVGTGLLLDGVALAAQDNLADVGAPAVLHAFPGDGHVVLDLALHHVTDIFHIHGVGEFHDLLDGQAGLIGQALLGRVGDGQLQELLAVALDEDDVGVVVDDAQAAGVALALKADIDIKDQLGIGSLDVQIHLLHVIAQGLPVLVGQSADDLQLPVGITHGDAHADGGGQAVESAGVGDHDALDVLDDVATDEEFDLLRQAAQNLAGLGAGVGQSDGFGAAHGGAQFFTENIYILLIEQIFFFHGITSNAYFLIV